ncbi:14540_t:CDS:2 [Dentiscutata heterogama]|uniref:14540_t:CDS:1 n=1 Tax=Dentiscutata heterogama TaxID=1316150 RepID=A0ACA9K7S3_9GLOM|nr:14540_t:CDS:2 [Dentiscutata heterogama]
MGSEIQQNADEVASATGTNDINTTDITPSEPIQRTPEQIEEKRCILEQVEYYFGDKNFPKDKFLNELCSKDPERWVPLAIVRQFRKMQVYKDDALIVEALRESPEILEVDGSGTKIRRKTPIRLPIPEYIKSGPMWKSIYAKGFDTTNQPSQKSIEDFFKKHGKVVKVTARKNNEKFKGSYFIQFEKHEEAKKISEMDLFFNGVKLIIMMKFDYCEMKCVEKGLDPDTMRKQIPQPPIQKTKSKPTSKYETNCLLHFKGAGPNVRWEDIKAKMGTEYGNVVFVKLEQQLKSGIIQFKDPIASNVASSIPNDDLEFDGFKPVFTVLQGEEEKIYYLNRQKAVEGMKKKSNLAKKNNAQKKVDGKNDSSDCSSTSVVKVEGKDDAGITDCSSPSAANVEGKNDAGVADCSSTSAVNVESKNDVGVADCSSTSVVRVEDKNDTGIVDCSSTLVVGNKHRLDDTADAEKSSETRSVKLNLGEERNGAGIVDCSSTLVVGNKRKLDDTADAEKSSETRSVKLKLGEDKNDTGIVDCSSTLVVGNKRKLDDIADAEKSSETRSIKLKLGETVSRRPDK